ncbi:MAG: hypothetical protein M0024_09510 [Nitrospiraceae bacterium]|nr:hypothetical protein [Nitrospiraceae bacterium]
MKNRVTFPVAHLRAAFILLFVAASAVLPSGPAQAGHISLFFDSSGRRIPAEGGGRNAARYARTDEGDPLGNVTREYYPVSGGSFTEIMRTVGENEPYNRKAGRRLPWKLDWTVGLSYDYSYKYLVDDAGEKLHAAIEISGIALRDSGTATLPSLIDDTSLNPVEKNLWEGYLANITTHCRDVFSIVRDPKIAKEVRDRLGEINYLIFDYSGDMDIGATIESYLQEDAARAGQDWVREINGRIAAYEEVTGFGALPEKRKQFFDKFP